MVTSTYLPMNDDSLLKYMDPLIGGISDMFKSFAGKFNPYLLQRSFSNLMGVQWLSGKVLDSRLRGRGFEPHLAPLRCVLEQDTLILA